MRRIPLLKCVSHLNFWALISFHRTIKFYGQTANTLRSFDLTAFVCWRRRDLIFFFRQRWIWERVFDWNKYPFIDYNSSSTRLVTMLMRENLMRSAHNWITTDLFTVVHTCVLMCVYDAHSVARVIQCLAVCRIVRDDTHHTQVHRLINQGYTMCDR